VDTVFYAWQSDLDPKTNRFFVGDGLEKAVKLLKREGLEVDPRIDQDARDCSGSPDIAAEILKKINKCRVFVADVSIINGGAVVLAPGKNPGGVEVFSLWEKALERKPDDLKRCRHSPNPNVMIELGYAARAHTWERVICVINEAYGQIEELPFDIRPRGMVRFSLLPTASDDERKQQKETLMNLLKGALEVAIVRNEAERAEQERLLAEEASGKRAEEEARKQAEQRSIPSLDIQFADTSNRKELGKAVTVESVIVGPMEKTKHSPLGAMPLIPTPKIALATSVFGGNPHYEEEMREYISASSLLVPLAFAVKNTGFVVAEDVHVEIRISQECVPFFKNEFEYPRKPKYRTDLLPSIPFQSVRTPDIIVRPVGNDALLQARLGKVAPGKTNFASSVFYVGSKEARKIDLEATVYADNLPSPLKVPMSVTLKTSERSLRPEELRPPSRDREP
jgi:hypothetical protein